MTDFIDQVRILVRSGDGGNGMVAWRREKYEPMGGPAGGNGGRGGHVYLEADANLATLIDFRYKHRFEAPPGKRGGPKGMHGRHGDDLTIRVPPGTVVKDRETDQIIADLTEPGAKTMIAEGGRGGRGNAQLASPTRRAPSYCEPGQPGIERDLELELKLIADVGIVGLPNAGKSTLLSTMTAARPKIADYPFSTLSPNLGVVKIQSGDGYVLADIPGLVKGASQGVGLGHKFLRHVERTRLLVHLADITSADVESDIRSVNEELHLYNERLDRLPQIVVLNKIDLFTDEEREKAIAGLKKRLGKLFARDSRGEPQVFAISCATRAGLDALSGELMQRLDQIKERPAQLLPETDAKAREHRGDDGFVVMRRKGVFTVSGDRVERLVSVTNMRNYESLQHLYHVLRSMGVIEALQKEGIEPGSEVVMGGVSFSFGEDMT